MAIIYRGRVGGNYQYWNENESVPMGATDITVINVPVLTASHVDRSVYAPDGISGSLQTLTGSQPYLLSGPNITLLTNSLGQIEITGSGGGGGGTSIYRLSVLDYYSTNAVTTTTAGQVIFPANQFTGSLVLYGVISNQLSTATASVQFYNITSGAYVEIGGPGVTHISVSGASPTVISSVDLISASNFNSSSQAIYELQVSSSNGSSYGFFGGFELRPSGSFTGISYVTTSNYYISGTWEDGGNRLATTSSVALAGNLGTGYYADDVGADVYFFASGVIGGKNGSVPGVGVFGGDLHVSGNLTVDGTSPGGGGVTTLQQAYDSGVTNAATILFNATSSSLILSGGSLGINDPLLKLRPFPGFGNSIALMGYDGTNETSLLTMTSVTSLFGGAKILMRSTGDVNSFIGWKAGSGDLNNTTTPEAQIYYHPNASALKLETNGTNKVAIIDNGAYGGGARIAEFRNALSFAGPLIILSGSTISEKGFSGSLTTLRDGQPYMLAGPNITINTSSLGQIEITGSGGGGDVYWSSTTNNSIFTTGSVLIRSNDGSGTDSATDYGADIFFYVSGSSGSKDGSTPGVAVFGGDVVISGGLYGGSPLEIKTDTQITGGLYLSGNLQVGPPNTLGADVGFYVSGVIGGEGGSVPGVGVFGGDLVVSGNLRFLGGLTGSVPTGPTYWTSPSIGVIKAETSSSMVEVSRLSASLGVEASGSIDLSGSLYVSGNMYVSGTDAIMSFETTFAGNTLIVDDQNTTKDVRIRAGIIEIRDDYNNFTPGHSRLDIDNDSITLVGVGSGITPTLTIQNNSGFPTPGRDIIIDAGGAMFFSASNGMHVEANVEVTGTLINGSGSIALGIFSHAEGELTVASGSYSHAEGGFTIADFYYSHAEGFYTVASGNYSHAEGWSTIAYNSASHAEGILTVASGAGSHAEGRLTFAAGIHAHAEGWYTLATGSYSHAEGYLATSSNVYSHAEGQSTIASGGGAHAEGVLSIASGSYSHAEGERTIASGGAAHAEGQYTLASGQYSHAEGYLCTASLDYAHAEGDRTIASGQYSHAEGDRTTAAGSRSHAEGRETAAVGYASHAEGYLTIVSGAYAHVEGERTLATGNYSHAEGLQTTSSNAYTHAEGALTVASGIYSHAEGVLSIASGIVSHAEGELTIASGQGAHAEGYSTLASGNYSHAEGFRTTSSNVYAHAEGVLTVASGDRSHAEGQQTIASGLGAHAEGYLTVAFGSYSHAEGFRCSGSLDYTHAEGDRTVASQYAAHAEGEQTTAAGSRSHAEGRTTQTTINGYAAHAEGFSTNANAAYAHAEGQSTVASGQAAHSEGFTTTASGQSAHAEGDNATASGNYSHAEGRFTIAAGVGSHAEGQNTVASGSYSHAEGLGTIASGSNQLAIGKYNLRNNNFSIFVIGDGTGEADAARGDIIRVNSGSSIGSGIVEVTGSLSVSGSQSVFHQYGGLRYFPRIVTTLPYTASLNDYVIAVSASAGAGVQLPSSDFGKSFIVKDVSGSAQSNNITITAAGGELINGSANVQINSSYGSLTFVYFGAGIGWGTI